MRILQKSGWMVFLVTLFVCHLGSHSAAFASDDDAQEVSDALDVPGAEEPATMETALASEQLQTQWTFIGSFRPRLESRFNHHFGVPADQLNYRAQPDSTDTFSQQSRLGIRAQRGQLAGEWLLQHSAIWGTTGGNALTTPPLHIHRAWLRYNITERTYLQAGRFELAYGDHRVLGNVGWSQVGRAWDGLRFGVHEPGTYFIDAFAARYEDGTPPQANFLSQDSYLTGIYASWTKLHVPFLNSVDGYTLYDVRIGDLGIESPQRRHLATLGTRLNGQIDWFTATLEGAVQLGRQCIADDEGSCTTDTRPIRAWFMDSELSGQWRLNPLTLQLLAGFSYATGDNPDTRRNEGYDQLYPTAHRWLGRMDIIGPRTNLREFRAGVASSIRDTRLGVTVHDFTRLQPELKRVGIETNIVLTQRLVDNLSLELGHGVFIPKRGMTIDHTQPEGLANWSFVQLIGQYQ